MTHLCHWPGCQLPVSPAKWGCAKHWFMLPARIRKAITQSYRPGQEIDKRPSPGYLVAAMEARRWASEHAQVGKHRSSNG